MRSVVLTGVSRGLGAALFDQMAARGDRILAVGRTFTGTQQELAARKPDRIALRRADLAAPELPTEADLRWSLEGAAFGILLHNAGVVTPIGAVGTLPPADLAASVAVNLTAPMLLTDMYLRVLPPWLPASIVYVSSGAAHRIQGGWAAYCAGKAGAEMFFNSVALQLADRPIRVANVNPGPVDTGMQTVIREVAAGPAYFPDRERYVGWHERGELADPADVAEKIINEHLTQE